MTVALISGIQLVPFWILPFTASVTRNACQDQCRTIDPALEISGPANVHDELLPAGALRGCKGARVQGCKGARVNAHGTTC